MQTTHCEMIRACRSSIALTWPVIRRSTIQKCATVWALEERSSDSFFAPLDHNLARALRARIGKTSRNTPSPVSDQFLVNNQNVGRHLMTKAHTQKLQLRWCFVAVQLEAVQIIQCPHQIS